MSARVCVCVCVLIYLSTIMSPERPIFTQFFVHVNYGRGSVLLWRRSDTLRISGFVDGVISAHIHCKVVLQQ